jgi:hypothetical protein
VLLFAAACSIKVYEYNFTDGCGVSSSLRGSLQGVSSSCSPTACTSSFDNRTYAMTCPTSPGPTIRGGGDRNDVFSDGACSVLLSSWAFVANVCESTSATASRMMICDEDMTVQLQWQGSSTCTGLPTACVPAWISSVGVCSRVGSARFVTRSCSSPTALPGICYRGTTTTISSSVNPVSPNFPVRFTVALTTSFGIVSGNVTLSVDGISLGSRALSDGSASFFFSFAIGGSHVATAFFEGAAMFLSSTSPNFYETVLSPSNTSLSLLETPSSFIAPARFVIRVSPFDANNAGYFSLFLNNYPLTSIGVNASGQAVYASTFPAGIQFVRADYSGDSLWLGSQSATVSFTVPNPDCILVDNCSGNGLCVSQNTCNCNPHFYGPSCIALTVVSGVLPSFMYIGSPAVTVTVGGDNFSASDTYVCGFTGQSNVTATYVSSTVLKCVAPTVIVTTTASFQLFSTATGVVSLLSVPHFSWRYDCLSTNCHNGTCTNGVCNCAFGFVGTFCETEIVAVTLEPATWSVIEYAEATFVLPFNSNASLPIVFSLATDVWRSGTFSKNAHINTSGVIVWTAPFAPQAKFNVTVTGVNARSQSSATVAVSVLPSYTCSFSSHLRDLGPFFPAQGLTLRGSCTMLSGGGPLTISSPVILSVAGMAEIFVMTGSSGLFGGVVIIPKQAAGNYSVFCSHPLALVVSVTDWVLVNNLFVEPVFAQTSLLVNASASVTFAISNPSAVDLVGVNVSFPYYGLFFSNFSMSGIPSVISAGGTVNVTVSLVGAGEFDSAVQIYVTAQNAPPAKFTWRLTVIQPRPRVVVADVIKVGAALGFQTSFQICVWNDGQIATSYGQIIMPNAVLSTTSFNAIPPIAANASYCIDCIADIPVTFDFGTYGGNVVFLEMSSGQSWSLPLQMTVFSTNEMSIQIIAQDEFAFNNPSAHNLAGANVALRNSTTYLTGVTQTDGSITFNDLTEGVWNILVTATNHTSFQTTSLFRGAGVHTVFGFLQYNSVSYSFSVIQQQVADTYEVVLQATFTTHVPKPVLTLEPSVLYYEDMLVATSITMNLTNHGLIAGQAGKFSFPLAYRDLVFTFPTDLGDIPAESWVLITVGIHLATGHRKRSESCGEAILALVTYWCSDTQSASADAYMTNRVADACGSYQFGGGGNGGSGSCPCGSGCGCSQETCECGGDGPGGTGGWAAPYSPASSGGSGSCSGDKSKQSGGPSRRISCLAEAVAKHGLEKLASHLAEQVVISGIENAAYVASMTAISEGCLELLALPGVGEIGEVGCGALAVARTIQHIRRIERQAELEINTIKAAAKLLDPNDAAELQRELQACLNEPGKRKRITGDLSVAVEFFGVASVRLLQQTTAELAAFLSTDLAVVLNNAGDLQQFQKFLGLWRQFSVPNLVPRVVSWNETESIIAAIPVSGFLDVLDNTRAIDDAVRVWNQSVLNWNNEILEPAPGDESFYSFASFADVFSDARNATQAAIQGKIEKLVYYISFIYFFCLCYQMVTTA